MSRLPALRAELDIFPSPSPREPGLVLRDPLRYTDFVLVVPPALRHALPLFDGQHELEALEACLASLGLPVEQRRVEANALLTRLSEACFLEDERFEARREEAQRAFREAPSRAPAHAGAGYPESPRELRATFDDYRRAAPPAPPGDAAPFAIVAPHVSPFGGVETYAAAYGRVTPALADHTFVVLGTSHRGAPERFGLTEKPFETPFGLTRAAPELVRGLARAAPRAVVPEDYMQAVEHSVEFQVVFLQHATRRPDIEVVPILCGAFLESLDSGRPPERDDTVRAFFDALGELRARRDRVLFVLGVDLAHVGHRYGDARPARPFREHMLEVAAADRARLEALFQAEPELFLERVTAAADPLRWCGFAPLYTFMRSFPRAQGRPLHYDQWDIDEDSVVSFVAADYPELRP